MFIFAAIVMTKTPAEWLTYPLQTNPPDNLVTFLWVALGATVSVITVLAAYIRSLLAELRQGDKDHHTQQLAMTERVLTAAIEMREAVEDNTAAIAALSGELKRRNRAKGTPTRGKS